jgi:hypothetical protein
MKVSPVARTEALIVKEVDGETLVYDLKTDKAHCLNETAALVWKNCDGRKSVSEISKVLSADSNASVKDEVVWLALDQLEKFKLLEESPAKPSFLAGMTRRQMVARLGIAAVALPAIVAIVAPTAQAQGSGVIPPGFCCASPNDCVSGTCKQEPPNTPACNVYPPNPQNSGKFCQ